MLTSLPAVVVVGNHTQGLGIVRSAAVAGAASWVVNDQHLSLVRFSRHLTGYRRLPHGTLSRLDQPASAAKLVAALLALPVKAPAVLLGVDEDITRFIHQQRAQLAERFFIPALARDAIYDKHRFSELVPASARIETWLWDDARVKQLTSPNLFVVKGRSGNRFRRVTGEKAIRLNDFIGEVREQVFRNLPPTEVVVQSLVCTGRPVTSVCAFSVRGEIKGLFGYEKLRQHPNQFGTGTYLRSVEVGFMRPVAETILRALEYTGISEIEFIHDDAAGCWRVIEMNLRTWKSVHFATQCGANLVGQLLAQVAGQRVEQSEGYARGKFWADFATDLPQMWRDRTLHRYERGLSECVWVRGDYGPGLGLCTLFPLMVLEQWWSRRAACAKVFAPPNS